MANGMWRNARFRDTQFPLVIYGALSLLILFLSRAEANLFDRARAYMTDWTAPLLRAVQMPVNGAQHWASDAGGLFSLYRDNIQLKDENARLRQWQGQAVLLQAKLQREENLLRAVPQRQSFLARAHVIGHSGKPFFGTLIIDAGKAEGARPGQAVMDGRGLVGRIFVSGQHTSWVVLTTDINSRIPVIVGANREQAILAGDNSDVPVLEALRPRATVKAGDQIETSGDGGTVPSGIAVGMLLREQGLSRVRLFADPATADEIEIMRSATPPEALPQSAPQDRTMTAGMTPLAPPLSPAPQQDQGKFPPNTAAPRPHAVASQIKPESPAKTPGQPVPQVSGADIAAPTDNDTAE